MNLISVYLDHLSLVVRKPAFCIWENRRKLLATFSGCTAWFVSDLVGNPKDWFSHNKAHLKVQ